MTITESEIDCMRLWTLGIPAVALGTAHISQQQVELLFKLNVEELVIATDNDAAGRECARTLEEIFAGTFRVTYFDFDNTIAKDISDLSSDEITLRYENRKCLEFVLK